MDPDSSFYNQMLDISNSEKRYKLKEYKIFIVNVNFMKLSFFRHNFLHTFLGNLTHSPDWRQKPELANFWSMIRSREKKKNSYISYLGSDGFGLATLSFFHACYKILDCRLGESATKKFRFWVQKQKQHVYFSETTVSIFQRK